MLPIHSARDRASGPYKTSSGSMLKALWSLPYLRYVVLTTRVHALLCFSFYKFYGLLSWKTRHGVGWHLSSWFGWEPLHLLLLLLLLLHLQEVNVFSRCLASCSGVFFFYTLYLYILLGLSPKHKHEAHFASCLFFWFFQESFWIVLFFNWV